MEFVNRLSSQLHVILRPLVPKVLYNVKKDDWHTKPANNTGENLNYCGMSSG